LSSRDYGLHLFLSIVFLLLLLRIFPIVENTFSIAVFSCTSMPAMYALSYYRSKIKKLQFVKSKTGEEVYLESKWLYEAMGFAMSYVMGFIVFSALHGVTDLAVYTLAYVVVQGMRFFIKRVAEGIEDLGLDPSRPVIVLAISVITALTAFAVLWLFSETI